MILKSVIILWLFPKIRNIRQSNPGEGAMGEEDRGRVAGKELAGEVERLMGEREGKIL